MDTSHIHENAKPAKGNSIHNMQFEHERSNKVAAWI